MSNIYFPSARVCKKHGTVLSSDCGLYDANCGQCEMEADYAEFGDEKVPANPDHPPTKLPLDWKVEDDANWNCPF